MAPCSNPLKQDEHRAPPQRQPSTEARPGLRRRDRLNLALLWFGGFDLRVTLPAVPPVIPDIHRDLGLRREGRLTAHRAARAAPGGGCGPGRAPHRPGGCPRGPSVAGLLAGRVGSMVRGAGAAAILVLFAATLLMASAWRSAPAGLSHPDPRVVPARVGVATAVYSNGMLVGRDGPGVSDRTAGGACARRELAAELRVLVPAGVRGRRPAGSRSTRHRPAARSAAAAAAGLAGLGQPRLWRLGLVMGSVSRRGLRQQRLHPGLSYRADRQARLRDAALRRDERLPAAGVGGRAVPWRTDSSAGAGPSRLASLLVSAGGMVHMVAHSRAAGSWSGPGRSGSPPP